MVAFRGVHNNSWGGLRNFLTLCRLGPQWALADALRYRLKLNCLRWQRQSIPAHHMEGKHTCIILNWSQCMHASTKDATDRRRGGHGQGVLRRSVAAVTSCSLGSNFTGSGYSGGWSMAANGNAIWMSCILSMTRWHLSLAMNAQWRPCTRMRSSCYDHETMNDVLSPK